MVDTTWPPEIASCDQRGQTTTSWDGIEESIMQLEMPALHYMCWFLFFVARQNSSHYSDRWFSKEHSAESREKAHAAYRQNTTTSNCGENSTIRRWKHQLCWPCMVSRLNVPQKWRQFKSNKQFNFRFIIVWRTLKFNFNLKKIIMKTIIHVWQCNVKLCRRLNIKKNRRRTSFIRELHDGVAVHPTGANFKYILTNAQPRFGIRTSNEALTVFQGNADGWSIRHDLLELLHATNEDKQRRRGMA